VKTIIGFILFMSLCSFTSVSVQAQQRSLKEYVQAAITNNPVIKDNRNLSEIARLEAERLKGVYLKPQLFLSAAYSLAPLISSNGITTNPDAAGMAAIGYDPAITNGGLYSVLLNAALPVFNDIRYQAFAEQTLVQTQVSANTIEFIKHDLEKLVADQYILCVQDASQVRAAEDAMQMLGEQKNVVVQMVQNGLLKQSEALLMDIELKNQHVALVTLRATYKRNLLDLNVLCGIQDTSTVQLAEPEIILTRAVTLSKFVQKFVTDSMSIVAAQKAFDSRYEPQVNVFANTGLNATQLPDLQRRFGLSVGVNASLTLFDGGQQALTQQKTNFALNSVAQYRELLLNQNEVRKTKILQELAALQERIQTLTAQSTDYKQLLGMYKKELLSGQLSVVNYITTLRLAMTLTRDRVLAETNKLFLINAYNYWNW
jgi:outer membrane protein TolC